MSEPQGSTSIGSSRSRPEGEAEASSSEGSSASEACTEASQSWTIPYVAPSLDWKPTPVVDVTIIGPGTPLNTMAVIDSGADSSALPFGHAAELGIDLESECSRETGMSSGGDTEHRIFRPGLEAEVFGHRFKIDATFTDTPVILLGQDDFFMQFHVSFDRPAQEFTLRLHD